MSEYEKAMRPEDITRLFVERSNAGDAAGVAALYEEDAVLACPPGELTVGREAIRALWEKVLANSPVRSGAAPADAGQRGHRADVDAAEGRGGRAGPGGPTAARRELAAGAGPAGVRTARFLEAQVVQEE